MTPPLGKPSGYLGLRLLLALIAIVQFVLVGMLIDLTPVRAALFALAAGLSIALSVLAFRAFGRAQRWALRYCQFVLVMVLVQGAATIFSAPPGGLTIPILGVLGLWMLGPAIGSQMAEWFSHSRPIGPRLTIALVIATVAGYGLPYVASAVPDPTQVSASDLDLQVSAVCTRDASGGVTAIDVNTRLRWSRLDLFPYGLGQGNVANSWQDGFETGPPRLVGGTRSTGALRGSRSRRRSPCTSSPANRSSPARTAPSTACCWSGRRKASAAWTPTYRRPTGSSSRRAVFTPAGRTT